MPLQCLVIRLVVQKSARKQAEEVQHLFFVQALPCHISLGVGWKIDRNQVEVGASVRSYVRAFQNADHTSRSGHPLRCTCTLSSLETTGWDSTGAVCPVCSG